MKAEYVADRLPQCVTQVGMKADVRNFWLFPILVVSFTVDFKTAVLEKYGLGLYIL